MVPEIPMMETLTMEIDMDKAPILITPKRSLIVKIQLMLTWGHGKTTANTALANKPTSELENIKDIGPMGSVTERVS